MFEAYNEDGSLQVSAEDYAYYLHSKGSINTGLTIWPPGHEGSTARANGVSMLESEIVAFSCSTAPVAVAYIYEDIMTLVTNGAHTVNYWRFRRFDENSPSTSGAGMELYDENGAPTFSTVMGEGKVLRYVSNHAISSMFNGMNTFVALPSGRDYAYIVNNPSLRQTFATGGVTPTYHVVTGVINPPPNARASGIRNGTNGFYIQEVEEYGYTMGSQFNGSAVVVDVTGY